jgi:hypothetical protein
MEEALLSNPTILHSEIINFHPAEKVPGTTTEMTDEYNEVD